MTAGFRGIRNAKRLAAIAAALAFWLAGTSSTAEASCGDYLVGVQASSGPMRIDHSSDHSPTCRPSDLPITPPIPLIAVERAPADPAVQEERALPTLEQSGWWDVEAPLLNQLHSQTLDRPPKA